MKTTLKKVIEVLTDPVDRAVTHVHLPVILSSSDHNICTDQGIGYPEVKGQESLDFGVGRRGGSFVGDDEGGVGQMEGWRNS